MEIIKSIAILIIVVIAAILAGKLREVLPYILGRKK